MKNTSISLSKRLLINKSKSGRYQTPNCIDKLLRYIARENGTSKDDLICCGSIGATAFTDISYTIQQFKYVQTYYKRNGNFGRYMDHEIYSFPPEIEDILKNDGFQVYYGVHKKDSHSSNIHIHFAVNTVNFITQKKRHENYQATKEREERLNRIVNDSVQDYLSHISYI